MGRRDPKVIHYRRCHICGCVTERDAEIEKCSSCGKPVAPFVYYDDKSTPVPTDIDKRTLFLDGEFRPIIGLTAYW